MKIIDVSTWNGSIDFSKVKKAGIGGVIIRAGFGTKSIDDRFKQNIERAIAAGWLHIGIYWFSYALSSDKAKAEAKFCASTIKPYKAHIDLGVYFDWEYDSMRYAKEQGVNPGKTLITNMNKAFCSQITKEGYRAGYYINLNYSRNYVDERELRNYLRWLAHYTKDKPKNCYLWQYTEKGKVSGVSGAVDISELIGKVNPIKKTNEQIANEVIAGKWGNGDDRKKRLTAAGYDYKVIQGIVNRKLR